MKSFFFFGIFCLITCAGDNGFEPLQTAPEAVVLPLDESPIFFQRAVLYHAGHERARPFYVTSHGFSKVRNFVPWLRIEIEDMPFVPNLFR